MALQGKGELQ